MKRSQSLIQDTLTDSDCFETPTSPGNGSYRRSSRKQYERVKYPLRLWLYSTSPLGLFPVWTPARPLVPGPRAMLFAIHPANTKHPDDVPFPGRRRLQRKKSRQFPGLQLPTLRSIGLPLSNSRSFLPAQLSFLQSCFSVPLPNLLYTRLARLGRSLPQIQIT